MPHMFSRYLQHTGLCLQEIMAFIYLFIPFFIIQLIHLRVREARLLRHQLPNSLPITNKQQRRGSDVERPTVKVVAQAVSSGLLVGSAMCRSCGLAHGEMYVFDSSQEMVLVGRRSRRHVARARHFGCHTPACYVQSAQPGRESDLC